MLHISTQQPRPRLTQGSEPASSSMIDNKTKQQRRRDLWRLAKEHQRKMSELDLYIEIPTQREARTATWHRKNDSARPSAGQPSTRVTRATILTITSINSRQLLVVLAFIDIRERRPVCLRGFPTRECSAVIPRSTSGISTLSRSPHRH